MPNQITVFLENNKGRLASMCRIIADANVNMTALSVADTADYGVARIMADKPKEAVDALLSAGYRAKLVDVSAVAIPNVPGSLATLFEAFDEAGINLEYAYCFASTEENVTVAFRVENPEMIGTIAEQLGYKLLSSNDL